MKKRMIAFGNRDARQYIKNPTPPQMMLSDPEQMEYWATKICKLSIEGVPVIGEDMEDVDGNIAYTVTEAHRCAFLGDLIEKLVEVPGPKGKKLCTRIAVSKDSNVRQALDEISRIWDAHAKGAPAWISGTDPVLVAVLAEDMGIEEVRDYEEAQ